MKNGDSNENYVKGKKWKCVLDESQTQIHSYYAVVNFIWSQFNYVAYIFMNTSLNDVAKHAVYLTMLLKCANFHHIHF